MPDDQPIDVDSLATKILQALGRRRPADEDEPDDDYRRGRVPQERLRREIDKRRAAEAALADMQTQVESLQAGYRGQIADIKRATADQVKLIGQRHAEDLSLVDAGLTDALGRQALRAAWDASAPDGRGKSPAAWWTQTLAAHKLHGEDGEKNAAPTVPRTLIPYLPAAEAPPQNQQTNGWGAAARARSAPPAGPARSSDRGIAAVPIDQGMEDFFAGLRRLG